MCSESTRDRSNLHLFVSILKPFVEIDDICLCEMRLWKSDKLLVLQNVDGVNYMHVKQAGLLFVATTRVNLSPALVLELLQRIARVTKDYLGVLNEDSLRKNFVLVYELLDEMIDFGYPQTTSTEALKSFVFNEPVVVDSARMPSLGPAALFIQGSHRLPGTAVTKSVVANEPGGKKREEVFVDIIEKISVTFNSSVSYALCCGHTYVKCCNIFLPS
jgi:AP-4 complex subunit mu-1